MPDIVVRTLRREYVITGQDVGSPLFFLDARPSVAGHLTTTIGISVRGRDHAYTASIGSDRQFEGSLRYLAAWLDRHILSCAVGDEIAAVALQSALMTAPDGRRALLVGGRRTGKSMLAAGLLAAGWMFEGDERVFLGPHGVVAHPRPLRIPESLARRAPRLAPLMVGAPSLDIDGTGKVFSLDPTRIGREWRTEVGPIAIAFFPHDAGQRYSTVRRLSVDEASARTIEVSSMVHGVTARAFAVIRSQLQQCPCFHLELGQLDGAVDCILEIVAGSKDAIDRSGKAVQF